MKVTLEATNKIVRDSLLDKSSFGMTNSINIRLTANFGLDEFVISQVAERHGYENEPNEKQIENLKLLCQNILQPLRDKTQAAIFINSGFRSFHVNAAVGGRFNSQHLEGKAADFIVPSMDLVDVFNLIRQDFQFDQLIFEFEKWIHISWNGENNRNDVLLSKKVYGKTVYEKVQNLE